MTNGSVSAPPTIHLERFSNATESRAQPLWGFPMFYPSFMLRMSKISGILLLLSNTLLPLNAADEEKPIEPAAVNLGRPVDFDGDVYPILQANCVACHNSTTAESDLIVETAEAMLKGGSL
ncbi:MAG: hypothetical protein KDA96_22225, partial [Planctomycetaceae bacterium]|nr:hypothetical protein [Planctomycetaceae bacterium]